MIYHYENSPKTAPKTVSEHAHQPRTAKTSPQGQIANKLGPHTPTLTGVHLWAKKVHQWVLVRQGGGSVEAHFVKNVYV